MYKSLILLLTLSLIGCGNDNSTDEYTLDIIITNAKGDIDISDKVYQDTDSVRITIDQLESIYVNAEGMKEYYGNIFPFMSIWHDEEGIGKIYITLQQSHEDSFYMLPIKQENQRAVKLTNSKFYPGLYPICYTFSSIEEVNEQVELYKEDESIDGEFRFNNNEDEYHIRHVKEGITKNGVYDVIKFQYDETSFNNQAPFESYKGLNLEMELNKVALWGVENTFSAVQMDGTWVVKDDYGKEIYRHPFKSHSSDSWFNALDKHEIRDLSSIHHGVMELYSEVILSTLNDLFSSKRMKELISLEHPIFDGGKEYNNNLETIHLKNNGINKTLEECLNSVVMISDYDRNQFGSGSIISEDGFVITNYHVVSDFEDKIIATFQDGSYTTVTLERWDKELDVALLKLNTSDHDPIKINLNPTIKLGEQVYNIGTPSNTILRNSVMSGNISAIRSINNIDYIQTDGNPSGGMSGGPLLNTKGEQIGMHVWGWKSSNSTVYGINFDIPIKNVLSSLNIVLD